MTSDEWRVVSDLLQWVKRDPGRRGLVEMAHPGLIAELTRQVKEQASQVGGGLPILQTETEGK